MSQSTTQMTLHDRATRKKKEKYSPLLSMKSQQQQQQPVSHYQYPQHSAARERNGISSRESQSIRNSREPIGSTHQSYATKQQPILTYSTRNSSHMIYQDSNKPNKAPPPSMNQIQITPSHNTTTHQSSATGTLSGNTSARSRQDHHAQQQQQRSSRQNTNTKVSRTSTNTPAGQQSPFMLLSQHTITSSIGTRGGVSTSSNSSSRKQTPEKLGQQSQQAGGAKGNHGSVSRNDVNYVKYFHEFDDIENINADANGMIQQRRKGELGQNGDKNIQFSKRSQPSNNPKFVLLNNAQDRRNTHAHVSLGEPTNNTRQSSDSSQYQGAFLEGLNVQNHLDQGLITSNNLQPQYEAYLAHKIRGKRSIEQQYQQQNLPGTPLMPTYTPSSTNKQRIPNQQIPAAAAAAASRTSVNYSLDRGFKNSSGGTGTVKLPKSRGSSFHDTQTMFNTGIPSVQRQLYQQQNNKQKMLNVYRADSTGFDESFNEGSLSIQREAHPQNNKHMDTVLSTTVKGDKSFDGGLDTTLSHIHEVSYVQGNQSQVRMSSEVIELIEAGQKQFRDNELSKAIICFQKAQQLDSGNIEVKYLLGVCYLGKMEYEDSVRELLAVIEKNPNCRKNVFLLVAIAFKKMENISAAVRMVWQLNQRNFLFIRIYFCINKLTKVLSNYPQYFDALIYRGKLLIKEKQWDKALSDFEQAISISPEKGIGYLGKADCLKAMNQFSEAVDVYSKAIGTEGFTRVNALLKRAITLIDDKQYERALEDLNEIIQTESDHSEAFYYKGVVNQKLKDINEAILNFEQAIKFNKSKKSVTKSLYEIARMQIEQRDFYQAYHTLRRSDSLDTDKKMLEKCRLFTEAVIFLMKRKFKDAIDNFNLITQNFTLGDFLKPLFYLYRAYGYFCLGKHQLALYDYLASDSSILSGDINSTYNHTLLQGILAVVGGKFDNGIELFREAEKQVPTKMEPFFYCAMTRISLAFDNSTSERPSVEKASLIQTGLKELDRAVELSDSNANLFYYRAVVRCYLGYFDKALTDIDKAIEKSEDNVPKYFYLRGHSFACMKQYKQGISDLSIAIQLDEKYADAFLERAKCYHFIDESSNAFADLQKYISLRPADPNIHLYAGNLLFNNGAYDDAIRAYSHSDLIETSPDLLLLRAKCSIVLLDLPTAHRDLTTVNSQLNKSTKMFDYQFLLKIVQMQASKSIAYDRACLTGLMSIIDTSKQDYDKQIRSLKMALEKTNKACVGFASGQSGRVFDKSDLSLYIGILEFYSGNFIEALKSFNSSLQLYSPNSLDSSNYIRGDAIILFNITITLIMLKRINEAYEMGHKLTETMGDLSAHSIFSVLLKLLSLEKEGQQAKKNATGWDDNEMRDILVKGFIPDSSEMRLYDSLPAMNMNLNAMNGVKLRLMLGFPLVEAPDLQPTFQRSLIENIQVTVVENKPEAPWIRKIGNGVIFTDNVQVFEHLDINSDDNQKNPDDNDRRIEIDRMKAKLMLDKDIETKLKNIKKTTPGAGAQKKAEAKLQP